MHRVTSANWFVLLSHLVVFLVLLRVTFGVDNRAHMTPFNCSITSPNLSITSSNCSITSSNLSVTSSNCSITSSNLSVTSCNCSITWSKRFGGLDADCTGRNLRRVPILNGNITSLDLSRNKIILKAKAFDMFPFLVNLKLSNNGLTILPKDLFNGSCHHLTFLDLSDNKLKYNYTSYSRHVFDPLINLRELNLGFNKDKEKDVEYPDKIFHLLVNLQNLTIDTFSKTDFKGGFGNLSNLKMLQLSGHMAECSLEEIHNDTFSIFKSTKLRILDISDCKNVTRIDAHSFAPLNHLQDLHLDDTHAGLHQVLQAMHGFVGRNMSSITLDNIQLVDVPAIETVKDEILQLDDIKYLNTICLSKLSIANNHMLYINLTSFLSSRLATCLKHFNVRDNALYGLYNVTNELKIFSNKSNIEYLDVSNFYGHCQSEKRKSEKYSFINVVNNSTLFFPQKLKTFIVDSMSVSVVVKRGVHLSFFSNVLETISISHFDKIVLEGSISGFNNLTTLKIAYNNDMSLSESFFDTFPSLQNLSLNDVALPEDFFYNHGRRLFSRLDNLVMLNLSGNQISHLPRGIFADNPLLKTLLLSNNRFHDIPFNINNIPGLLFIDLSYNKIRFISDISRNELDDYAKKNPRFRLSLSGNNFVCFCNDIFFVFWLQENNYISNNGSEHTCLTQSGINTSTLIMDIDGEQLWQSCVGKIFFFIASSLTTFASLAFVSSILVVKHKTQIMCFLKKLVHRTMVFPKRKDFKYDVFLGYADEDYPDVYFALGKYLEDHLGYCLYMYHRDSIPGEDRAASILHGINNSWKTVFFMSQTFLDDHWSFYSMQAAVYATSELIPNRIILVKDQTNPCEIPNFILCVVDEARIIETLNVDASWEILQNIINQA